MRNTLKAATLAATVTATTFVAAAMSPAAQAVTVTRIVNGTSYDISTVQGSFGSSSFHLQSEVWWGDQDLAALFAMEVKDALGTQVNSSFYGPWFAYDFSPSTGIVSTVSFSPFLKDVTLTDQGARTRNSVWATATPTAVPIPIPIPIPIPTPALLPGLVGMGVAALRKRKQEAEA